MYRKNFFLSQICCGQKIKLFLLKHSFCCPLDSAARGCHATCPYTCPLTPLVNGKPSVTQITVFSDTESLNAKQQEVLQFKVMAHQLA
jgi:hypothetical protein